VKEAVFEQLAEVEVPAAIKVLAPKVDGAAKLPEISAVPAGKVATVVAPRPTLIAPHDAQPVPEKWTVPPGLTVVGDTDSIGVAATTVKAAETEQLGDADVPVADKVFAPSVEGAAKLPEMSAVPEGNDVIVVAPMWTLTTPQVAQSAPEKLTVPPGVAVVGDTDRVGGSPAPDAATALPTITRNPTATTHASFVSPRDKNCIRKFLAHVMTSVKDCCKAVSNDDFWHRLKDYWRGL
jgi:hypothetical protein